jgi:glycosyltransferase involved in cell wall biosynthesis
MAPASKRGDGRRPTVAVSIPYFAAGSYVRRAVESILDQTYPDLEVFLISDGDVQSPPWESLSDLDDPRLRRFEFRSNNGPYFVHSTVLHATAARYLLIQDADDWSDSKRVEALVHLIESEHSIGALSAERVHWGSMSGPEVVAYFGSASGSVVKTQELPAEPVPELELPILHHGLFDAGTLRDIGGYYGGFRVGYDTFLMQVLMLLGGMSLSREPLYNRVLRGDSLTGSKETGIGSEYRSNVAQDLGNLYRLSFESFERFRAGELDRTAFMSELRRIAGTYVTPADRLKMEEAVRRMRMEEPASANHAVIPLDD